jgi:hypothetical protein
VTGRLVVDEAEVECDDVREAAEGLDNGEDDETSEGDEKFAEEEE